MSEIDYMEYANDGEAQTAYVTSDIIQFEDDFELNNLDKWTASTGWTTTDAEKKTGTYSAYVDSDTTSRYLIKDLPIALTNARLTFYARVERTDKQAFLVWNAGENMRVLMMQSDGHFKSYYDAAYHNLPVDTTYLADTWYKIVVEFVAATNSIKYWIDDGYKGEVTDIAFASINWISIGSDNAVDADLWIDDVKMENLVPALQCYSEDTIKEQGSHSLKVVAAQTNSLNATLTRTIA